MFLGLNYIINICKILSHYLTLKNRSGHLWQLLSWGPLLCVCLPVLSKSISHANMHRSELFSVYSFFFPEQLIPRNPLNNDRVQMVPCRPSALGDLSLRTRNAFTERISNRLALGKQTCKASEGIITHSFWALVVGVQPMHACIVKIQILKRPNLSVLVCSFPPQSRSPLEGTMARNCITVLLSCSWWSALRRFPNNYERAPLLM